MIIMLQPHLHPLAVRTLPVVKKIIPLTVVFHTSLLGITACDSSQTQKEDRTVSSTQTPEPTSTPVFEVQSSMEQLQFAQAVVGNILHNLDKEDAVLEIVVSSTAHEVLPFGKLDAKSVTMQRWLYLIRESYAYHRLDKYEAMEQLDTLLAHAKKASVNKNDTVLRILGLLSQVALLEQENEK